MEGNNKRLVVVLAGALGCSLLAIAFLLGRVTAKPGDGVRIEEATPALAAPTATVGPIAPAPEPAAGGANDSTPGLNVGPIPFPPIEAPGKPVAEAASSNPLTADQQAIAAYFVQLERIEDVGAGDPQAFAASMLQSVSSGDFSGFDDLLTKSRLQQERLRRVATPQACREHHGLALALSADSVSMLERIKAALMRGDSTALITIASEGRTLEEQANRLKSMGEAIKKQAGL